jgi:uncharacterized protein YbjQ (UPF0145 family)
MSDMLPEAALERLRDAGSGPFSSALGVAEALLIRQSGLEPVTQVMGSSIFKVGWQQMPWAAGGGWYGGRSSETFELEAQTEAYNEARRLSVDRLREEARLAGADGVVGVSIRRGRREGMSDLLEFVAVGTAVRSTRFTLDDEAADGPWLCNLSGQDVAKLIAHGFWPLAIVGGSTVAYVASGTAQQWRSRGFLGSMRNQEMADFSRGLSDARLLAMDRVERQAHAHHAHGVVGVSFERTQREIERDVNNTNFLDLIVEIHVIGTAIVEVRRHGAPPPIHTSLPLK